MAIFQANRPKVGDFIKKALLVAFCTLLNTMILLLSANSS
jgi:hypothetical protein